MDYEKLLKMLDISEAEEFQYFENFADLVEASEEVQDEALYKLFAEVNTGEVAEIIENYFDDITNALPDESTDIYTLIETIKLALVGLLHAVENDETALVHFCDELNDFKTWYSNDSKVECKDIEGGKKEILCLRDALSLCRIERLEGDKYGYDFEHCLDYQINEYIMSYADMANGFDDEDNEFDDSDAMDDIMGI